VVGVGERDEPGIFGIEPVHPDLSGDAALEASQRASTNVCGFSIAF